MHDTAVIQALCDKVEQMAYERGAKSVLRIALEVPDSTHFTPEHMQETFDLFRGSSPLLRETKLEFRYTETVPDREMILRDVELELPDQDQD